MKSSGKRSKSTVNGKKHKKLNSLYEYTDILIFFKSFTGKCYLRVLAFMR